MSVELGVSATTDAVVPGVGDPAELLVPTWDYARRQLPDAFDNLDEVLVPLLRDAGGGSGFDTTVFYSRRHGLSAEEEADLARHNERAYSVARNVGGLIIYYQGPLIAATKLPDSGSELGFNFEPDCMSFCIWQSREHSKAGSEVPEHRAAVAGVSRWYRAFGIKKFRARLETADTDGPAETVKFEPSSSVL